MEIQNYLQVMQLAMSANPAERKAAEAQLAQLRSAPGYVVGLLQIVVRGDIELSVRQMASIYFKNVISKDWRPKEGGHTFPEEEKKTVRDNLLEAIICAPVVIRSQLVECLRTVVSIDFPEQWPGLVPQVDANLRANDQSRIYGALVALRLLSRKYEFKDDEERAPIHPVVAATFPLLLSILKYLLALPSPSLEIADMIKLVCKIFWSSAYLQIPELLHNEAVFLEWMACFHTLLQTPVPAHDQPQDPELRPQWAWWKVKKWVLHIINRMYKRFGDPKMAKGQSKAFALVFQRECAARFLQAYLELLSTLRTPGGYLPGRVTNLALDYLTLALGKSTTYNLLKPHMHELLFEIIFPLLCYNDDDSRLWVEDPLEYVRKGYDIIEDMYSSRTAAVNFVAELVEKRGKENLPKLIGAVVDIFNRYEAAPAEQRPYRQKDGALLLVGALQEKLQKTEPYRDQLEAMLVRHVVPEFRSPMGHLRAKAAWVCGQYADIEYSSRAPATAMLHHIVAALKDPDLPVRVDSVVALRSFVDECEDLNELRPLVPTLLDDFFKLMNEVENEDLVFTLETIVDKFGEEMAPYAAGLVQNLAATFWRCVESTEEEGDDGDDAGAMAAVGCLRAIATILESISSLPHLYGQLEPMLLPIMTKMLTTDGQDVFEEVLEIVSYMTYFSPTISREMWAIWPLITAAVNEWAADYFENALGPLDNYISRGTQHFLTCAEPNYQESLYHLLHKSLNDENLSDREVESAPKLMEVVLHNCRGQVDRWIEPYLRLAVGRMKRADSRFFKDLLMEVVANCLHYDARLTLNVLQTLGVTSEIFTAWLQMVYTTRQSGKPKHFRRGHDMKVCILGLASLLVLPADTLPPDVRQGLPQVVRALLKLLVAYKEQQAEMAKLLAAEDDDDDEEEEDEDEGVENGGEDHDADLDEDDGDDEVDGSKLSSLVNSKWRERQDDDDDDDDDDDEFMDDEEFQTPLDKIDPFVFFADTMKHMSAQQPEVFGALTGGLDFQHQAMAHGVAQHAEERRQVLEKEAAEKAAAAAAGGGGAATPLMANGS